MGLWTGFLAGIVTAVVAPLLDLASGGGLDACAHLAGLLGLSPGAGGAALVGAAGGLLLAIVLGVAVALLPLRVAGSGSGVLLGAAAGLILLTGVGRRPASPGAVVLFVPALAAGLLTGFLYSRYVRTQSRPPGSRPFGAR